MGCSSSKAFGGNYPGQRPPAHKPYTPNGAAYEGGEAKAHFIQYGGGNALVLADGPNPTSIQPQQAVSNGKPEFIAVTLPQGVSPGDKIHVKAPDGRLNEIIVPPGMYPGSKFTVQFADGPPPTKFDEPEINLTQPLIAEPEINVNQPYVPMATAQPAQPQGDDDFASGFGSSSNKRY
mmetsp:Transcript_25891/g.39181  ORF Transcript_25891/g.39181 Transcript_25891/m.39181 type:complete len:178 (+) Transcript_25891:68-601(+)|eukprot:CAMPEP_0178919650 /NCGR_PEP_ID=MMETSP0786-20121207/14561_1 /TAXON_ID=186022 /ORGANISM="Thalassionema frauenfeldii, Strain CCMP 1798" /LENGTH=177 /DNA_ID=CAMNT_0020593617 /DNA_START=51 /DNA_END=584 /DNA_ORIENTATION=+